MRCSFPAQAARLWELLDKNHDGDVHLKDLESLLPSLPAAFTELFQVPDAEGDAVVHLTYTQFEAVRGLRGDPNRIAAGVRHRLGRVAAIPGIVREIFPIPGILPWRILLRTSVLILLVLSLNLHSPDLTRFKTPHTER